MRYAGLAVLIFGVDFFLKRWADNYKRLGRRKLYWKERIALWKYHNHGGFYNLGQGRPWLVRTLSVGLSIVTTVLFVLTLTRHGSSLLKTGLALMLGGAFSNTYDRLTKKYVVDYLELPKVPLLNKIIFNLSDFCIALGALLTVLSCGREKEPV